MHVMVHFLSFLLDRKQPKHDYTIYHTCTKVCSLKVTSYALNELHFIAH